MNFEIKIDDKLSLKLRGVEDAEACFTLTDKNREHLREWLPWVDVTLTSEDTKKYLEKQLENFSKKITADFGISYEGKWIGSMGFNEIDEENKWAEIGYWLAKDYEGRGLMTLCVQAMIDYGFKDLNLHRIQIRCDARNIRSKAIPERLGFTLEGVLRQNHKKESIFSDGLIYGLLKEEWSNGYNNRKAAPLVS